MKKIYALALCSALFLNFSCGSDSDSDGEINGSLDVEEGKSQLEDNNINLLNKIEDFKNDDALNEIVDLAEFLSTGSTSKIGNFKKTSINTISRIASVKSSDTDIIAFNTVQATALVTETPLTDDYNAEKGIYTWNADLEDFEKTGESEDIIYNIAYEGNTAVFSVTDFNTTIINNTETEEEVPSLVRANLKINNTEVFSQEFTASFTDNQLLPTGYTNTTKLGAFTLATSSTNSNNTSIKQELTVKIDNEVIIEFSNTVNGNFNDEETIEDKNIEDVVNNASVSFKLLDALLTVTAKDTGLDSDADLTIDEQIDLLNSNTETQLSINNKSVAVLEFYKDQDTYETYVYNNTTQNWEWTEVTEDVINARFLFNDGTTSDFETYFDGSFTSTENKFDSVFDAFETLFGNI